MTSSSKFDDSRIKDYPDKRLLHNLRVYYKTFTDPDPDAMRNLQTENFTISDIRKNAHTFKLPSPVLMLF
jgi:hypothetical protein